MQSGLCIVLLFTHMAYHANSSQVFVFSMHGVSPTYFAHTDPTTLCPPPGTSVWVAGRQTDLTHRLITYRGLAVCSARGARGSARLVNLALPCRPKARSHHARYMARFSMGLLLPGMTRWPARSLVGSSMYL